MSAAGRALAAAAGSRNAGWWTAPATSRRPGLAKAKIDNKRNDNNCNHNSYYHRRRRRHHHHHHHHNKTNKLQELKWLVVSTCSLLKLVSLISWLSEGGAQTDKLQTSTIFPKTRNIDNAIDLHLDPNTANCCTKNL